MNSKSEYFTNGYCLNIVKQIRVANNIFQVELAKIINVPNHVILRIENEFKIPKNKYIERMVEIFNINRYELFDLINIKQNKREIIKCYQKIILR